jgi:DMSO/TMAO reductase YedYZ heme-binding membrane subunit
VRSGKEEEGLNEVIRNMIATAALGLFGWHLVTLHNIAKSVDVLVNRADAASQRLERLENYVFVENGFQKK